MRTVAIVGALAAAVMSLGGLAAEQRAAEPAGGLRIALIKQKGLGAGG